MDRKGRKMYHEDTKAPSLLIFIFVPLCLW
jgi:hypothetical protein